MNIFSGVNRVIFDLDGTLISHGKDNEAIEIAHLLGIPITNNFIVEVNRFFLKNERELKYKRITREYYEYLIGYMIPTLKKEGRTGAQFLLAVTNSPGTILMDGAKETLDYLYNKGYVIVASTNWFANEQAKVLKKLKILEYFERIYGWDDNYPKPDERAFLRCLDYREPKENVFIGDSAVNDIAPAKRLGIYTVGFNIDRDKYKQIKYIPDAYINHLLQLKGIL